MQSPSDITKTPIVQTWILDEEQQVPSFQKCLNQHLPHSIPLCRRLQFHRRRRLQQPDKVRNAKVWLGVVTTNSRTVNSEPAVTSVPQAQSAVDIDEWLGSGPQLITTRDAWLAAYVDLSDPGQTQVWVFANWEVAMNMQPGHER